MQTNSNIATDRSVIMDTVSSSICDWKMMGWRLDLSWYACNVLIRWCWICLQNLRVRVDFPEKYFQVLFSSQNGTYHVVNTIHKGFTNLFGELKTVMLTVCVNNLWLYKLMIKNYPLVDRKNTDLKISVYKILWHITSANPLVTYRQTVLCW